MSVGDLIVLERIRWDWFVSCTVAARDMSDNSLRRLFFVLKSRILKVQKLDARLVPWALRIESGVDPRHRHFHFLIGGLSKVDQQQRFRTMATWDRMCGSTPENPRGSCRARLYDPAKGAAGYLADVLNDAEYKGWSEGCVEINQAAMMAARQCTYSLPAGCTS